MHISLQFQSEVCQDIIIHLRGGGVGWGGEEQGGGGLDGNVGKGASNLGGNFC